MGEESGDEDSTALTGWSRRILALIVLLLHGCCGGDSVGGSASTESGSLYCCALGQLCNTTVYIVRDSSGAPTNDHPCGDTDLATANSGNEELCRRTLDERDMDVLIAPCGSGVSDCQYEEAEALLDCQ